jgi:predicted secreted protein
MGWVSGIVVFLLVWWVMIFTVLPWGLRRDQDGTPQDPKIKKKLLITTAVSAVVWFVIYLLIESDMISFKDMAEALSEADRMKVGQQ